MTPSFPTRLSTDLFAKRVHLTPEELAQMMQDLPQQAPSAPFEPVAPDYRDHGSDSGGDDEPPGVMDVPHFDPEEHSSYSGQFEAAESPAGRQSGMARPGSARRHQKVRTVTPMAKRLLRLLLPPPELVSSLGDRKSVV